MSDDTTKNLPNGPSFEERVLTRLDAIQTRIGVIEERVQVLDVIEERLKALEDQAERRAMDTKPIWERALAEILEVKEGLGDVERKLDVLSRDIVKVRADQVRLDNRLDKLESKPM